MYLVVKEAVDESNPDTLSSLQEKVHKVEDFRVESGRIGRQPHEYAECEPE